MARRTVLVVDDEPDIRELLEVSLARMGLEAETASSVAGAQRCLTARAFDLVLTDMRLPDGDGLGVLAVVAELRPATPVAVITAYGSAENAVAALKAGAFDYLAKPIRLEQLRPLIANALRLPVAAPRRQPASPLPDLPTLVGEAAPVAKVRELIGRLARTQAPVVIIGESGTGKEVAARLIHAGSSRAAGPFVAVNCGAIPETLMESEFFGYRKGAFTGADVDREGYLHAANGGTLFLDEVADLPLTMQVKLLRVIQEKRFRRLGDTVEEMVDARIISATHRSLPAQVASGAFRQDLFYRLNVIELRMPALREIAADIPALAERILGRLASQSGGPVPTLTEAALAALRRHSFPGNVRELENVLERALALSAGGRIDAGDLQLSSPARVGAVALANVPLEQRLDDVERRMIAEALEAAGNDREAAARRLGLSLRGLELRLSRLGLAA